MVKLRYIIFYALLHNYSLPSSFQAITYILHNLEEYTIYEVKVQPFYFSIRGTASETFKAKTLEDVPSSPPEALTVRVDSLSAITITWDPPAPKDHNGDLRGYKVRL